MEGENEGPQINRNTKKLKIYNTQVYAGTYIYIFFGYRLNRVDQVFMLGGRGTGVDLPSGVFLGVKKDLRTLPIQTSSCKACQGLLRVLPPQCVSWGVRFFGVFYGTCCALVVMVACANIRWHMTSFYYSDTYGRMVNTGSSGGNPGRRRFLGYLSVIRAKRNFKSSIFIRRKFFVKVLLICKNVCKRSLFLINFNVEICERYQGSCTEIATIK